MTAAKYDIEIDQGSSFALAITVSENGSTKNLANFTPRAQLRPAVDSPDSDKTDFTFDESNKASGIIVLKLEHDVSSAMAAGNYVYDLEIFTGTAPNETSVTRIMQGKAVVNPEVTK
jgi:hypothetical protein